MKIHLLCAIGDYAVHTNLDPATFLASNSVLWTVFPSENKLKKKEKISEFV